MKKLALTLMAWQLVIFCFAQTIITGPYVSGHWTADGSPYQVMADITIPPDTALDYRLDVAYDGGFTDFVDGYVNYDAGNDTNLQVTLQELEDTLCYYRLRAHNTNVTGNNSNIIAVALGMATLPDIPRELPLTLVNTGNGILVRIQEPGMLPYTLGLYNLLGQPIVSLKVNSEMVLFHWTFRGSWLF